MVKPFLQTMGVSGGDGLVHSGQGAGELSFASDAIGEVYADCCGEASAKRCPASDPVVLRPDSPSLDPASCTSCCYGVANTVGFRVI